MAQNPKRPPTVLKILGGVEIIRTEFTREITAFDSSMSIRQGTGYQRAYLTLRDMIAITVRYN